MRLTADVVRSAPSYINPLKERELGLRGFKIPVIENLGVTEDQYDAIDLSENEILKLENFPLLTRLQTLLLSNNRIARISEGLQKFLPKLSTLMLMNNKLVNLRDIDPLSELSSLISLSLNNNPVTKHKSYRLYIIHKIPSLKLLDFKKIKPQERKEAEKFFGGEQGARRKEAISATEKASDEKKNNVFSTGESLLTSSLSLSSTSASSSASSSSSSLTDEDTLAPTSRSISDADDTDALVPITPLIRQKIMEKIKNANTLSEIDRLEKVLISGKIPADLR